MPGNTMRHSSSRCVAAWSSDSCSSRAGGPPWRSVFWTVRSLLIAELETVRLLCRIGIVAALAPAALAAQSPAPLPLKYAGPPTVPAITAGDLMTRLYAFADDSMMGRVVGTEHNNRATAYIEREVRRLG